MKGIILAGGDGTRLYPITKTVSKHLLPIYDKPLIYYPLSILMMAGIKEIAIIVTSESIRLYEKLLSNSKNLGITIKFFIQDVPNGIPEALNITSDFIKNDKVCMILGDNIFYGSNFINTYLKPHFKKNLGSSIFLYRVKDPHRFGIVELNSNKKIISICEKPIKPKSNLAITGIYIFDKNVTNYSKNLKKSSRGETEIIDLLKKYQKKELLNYSVISRGTTWMDAGTPDSLIKSSQLVQIIEERENLKIACLEQIAYEKKFIIKSNLKKLIKNLPKSSYKEYLEKYFDNECI